MPQLFVLMYVVATVAHGFIVAFVRDGRMRDIDLHREFGRRFLTGEYLYALGFCHPYMPTSALYFSPLALVDRPVAIAIRYTLGALALCLALALLHRMARHRFSELTDSAVVPGALAILLAFQFIVRDLDEAGPHLIVLAIVTAGIYTAWNGREKWSGMWFGLATALKVTPALFLLLFIFKRRWKLAVFTAIATVCWIVIPAVWMGPTSWWAHQKEWTIVAAGSFMGVEHQVTRQNEDDIRNQSLKQALLRYLVTYPQDHPLRQQDPRYVPILDLSGPTAQALVATVMAGVLVVSLWTGRRPRSGPHEWEWVRDCSVVLILTLLFSPVTWPQHLVWLVPALFVLIAESLSGRELSKLMMTGLALYVLLTFVLTYQILGKANYAWVRSFHPYTVAMLVVLAMLLARRHPHYSPEPVASRIATSPEPSR